MYKNLIMDLIANLAILTSSIVLIHYFFKNKGNFFDIHHLNTRILKGKSKLFIGLFFGIVGSILMFYGLRLGTGTLVDFRHFPIIISSLFGGIPSAFLTGSIIAISRIFFNGQTDLPSFIGALNAIHMAIACGLISTYATQWRKWIYLNIYCLISINLIAIYLIKDLSTLLLITVAFWTTSMISAICIFYLINYLLKTSFLQNRIKENEEQFRLISENMSDVVMVLDTTGMALYASPSIELFGGKPIEYIGKYPREYIHPDDVDRVREMFHKVVIDRSILVTEYRWRHATGDWIDVDMRGTPIIENGEVTKVVAVSRDISERKKMEQQLYYLSNIDGLTGLSNRRFFDRQLEKEWIKSVQAKTPLSLLFFDIDYFKPYNDTYGHPAGDRCLQKIGILVQELLVPPQVSARYGGEEFAIILPETDSAGAVIIAEKVREAIETLNIPHQASQEYGVITVSIGIATYRDGSVGSTSELMEQADKALYQTKNAGRNRVSSWGALAP
ncbi:diguanylate cyclase domain-containing protein [Neobacillus bataviensis]|uniref:diguanylate cyclase domain-containing protein n=1 Tax=Neobacillus bataviensis TaxID=220685 RepID=UPI001CBB6A03|nr:diguanylate cyclase [Neobacillus bataviensis]